MVIQVWHSLVGSLCIYKEQHTPHYIETKLDRETLVDSATLHDRINHKNRRFDFNKILCENKQTSTPRKIKTTWLMTYKSNNQISNSHVKSIQIAFT